MMKDREKGRFVGKISIYKHIVCKIIQNSKWQLKEQAKTYNHIRD